MRTECLDWLLILGPRHLERVLRVYVDQYNTERPHRALGAHQPTQGARWSSPGRTARPGLERIVEALIPPLLS